MKKLLVLIIALVLANSAMAIIDMDPNMMGFYFDTEADMPCIDNVSAYSTVSMFLVITNPDFENLYGFEAGYDFEGPATILSTAFANPLALNVGSPDNMIVGFGAPTPTAPVTTVAVISIIYTGTSGEAVEFYLHGTEPSSIDPAYPVFLLDDSVLMQGGVSFGGESATSYINGGCITATDNLSFDEIKSLYR